MAIMFGNGSVAAAAGADVVRTAVVRADANGKLPDHFVADVRLEGAAGATREKIYMGSASVTPSGMIKFSASGITLKGLTKEDGTAIQPTGEGDTFTFEEWASASVGAGEKVFVTYVLKATTRTITISGDSFPGTYYVTGDTYARSDVSGADQFFQFIIKKAKVTSENTITLEAEGDPSVFSMNLTVLRPEDGVMMELVQYDLDEAASV